MDRRKILLVDDTETSLKLIKAVYESDYDVFTANDGLEALEVLLQQPVDLVISDILMPNMDGYHLCYKIRTNPKLKDTPVIVYSATYVSMSEEKIAREMGANLYLRKPAPIKVLLSVAKEIIESPQKYPYIIPTMGEAAERMSQYSEKLIAKLEQNNIELEETNKKLSKIIKEVTDYKFALDESSIVAITDQKGIIQHANDNFCKISQYSREELIGQDHRIINSGYHPKEYIRNLWETIANGKIWKGEFKNKAKDGTMYWVDATIVPFLNERRKPYQYVAIRTDITRKKEIEEKLRQNKAKLKEAQIIARVGSWEIDMVTNIHHWSDEFYNIFGVNKEETTPSAEMFLSFIHPDDVEFVDKKMEEAFNTVTDSSFDFRFIRSDGALRYAYSKYQFEFNNNKKVERLYGIVQDITGQIEAEKSLNKLVKELTSKNNELHKTNIELDKFVYSTSHDLRAPLMSVLGLVEMCRDHVVHPEELGNLFSMMTTSVNRVDETIKSILAYSRNSRMEIKSELLDIKKIIEEIVDDLKYINQQVKFSIITRSEFNFYSDKIRIKSVLTNLISNAVKYKRSNESHPYVNITVDFAHDELTIIVEDNGEGIPKNLQSKVFEMFARASTQSTGSGLGLYISKEMVNKIGGNIYVESELGTGSVFTVKLPNLNAQNITS